VDHIRKPTTFWLKNYMNEDHLDICGKIWVSRELVLKRQAGSTRVL
jgi:hypothetical protein